MAKRVNVLNDMLRVYLDLLLNVSEYSLVSPGAPRCPVAPTRPSVPSLPGGPTGPKIHHPDFLINN